MRDEMTEHDDDTPRGRPAVYARLAADAEHLHVEHKPPAWSHWAGRVLVLAIAILVITMAVVVHPW